MSALTFVALQRSLTGLGTFRLLLMGVSGNRGENGEGGRARLEDLNGAGVMKRLRGISSNRCTVKVMLQCLSVYGPDVFEVRLRCRIRYKLLRSVVEPSPSVRLDI